MTLIDVLKKIDGADAARRVGTDAITPTFAALLPDAFPCAEIVDAELAMRAARRIKTADEIAAMGQALRVAEAGLAAAVGELRPGVSEQALSGAVLEAMAAGGVSTPATQDAAWVTSREHPWRRAHAQARYCRATSSLLRPAPWQVAMSPRWAGRGRSATSPTDRSATVRRSKSLYDNMLPPVAPLRRRASCSPPMKRPASRYRRCPLRMGWGWVSTAVVSEMLWAAGEHDRLEAGMVLAVTGHVWQEGVGAVFRRDTVHITDDGGDVLTTSPSWLDSPVQ